MRTQTIQNRILEELNKRKLMNSSYSLRAFARDLNINHSLLSRIIASKIEMTPKILERISSHLKLTPEETLIYKQEVFERKKSQSKEKVVVSKFRSLDIEEFKIIQDWYHFAIIELINFDDFQPTGEWISKKIGITPEEANLALNRLVDLNILKVTGQSRYSKVTDHISVMTPEYTAKAMRERQKAVLTKAIDALENLPIEIRDNSSITISLDSDLLPEIKEKIKKMRRSLANYISANSKKNDQVYELSISFFPWSKK